MNFQWFFSTPLQLPSSWKEDSTQHWLPPTVVLHPSPDIDIKPGLLSGAGSLPHILPSVPPLQRLQLQSQPCIQRVCVCVTCIWVCTFVSECLFKCVYLYVLVCTCVCVCVWWAHVLPYLFFVFLYVYMTLVSMYLCTCLFIYVCALCPHMCSMYVYLCVCMRVYSRSLSHFPSHIILTVLCHPRNAVPVLPSVLHAPVSPFLSVLTLSHSVPRCPSCTQSHPPPSSAGAPACVALSPRDSLLKPSGDSFPLYMS